MRSDFVVVFPPLIDDVSCVMHGSEPVLVETAIAELAVKRFHECVLRRFSWLDKMQLHVLILCPEEHRLARQFRAVVADDGLR